jgi:hypothetical protein
VTWEELCAELLPQPHTITVQAWQAAGAYGDVYADPIAVGPCVVDETTRRVVVQTLDAEGREAISSTAVYAPPSTDAPAGSRVTLPSGRATRVLAVSRLDAHGLDLPEHVQLDLE